MKRQTFNACVVACITLACATAAFGSSLVIESKTAPPQPTFAGVYLTNDQSLRGINIPLVVRQIETFPVALGVEYAVDGRLRHPHIMTGVMFLNYYDSEDGICKQGLPGGFGTINGGGSGLWSVDVPSPSDPDAFLFSRNIITDGNLPAGTDGVPPDGYASIRINFTCPILDSDGQRFFIDTTCTNPAQHLLFILNSGQSDPTLTFTPGTITCERCECPYQGDGDEDGFLTVLDLQIIGRILFRGEPDVMDPQCPTWRFDLDCDGFDTALDLAVMIDHLFVNGPPPCDPCAP